ncbi:MAG: polysaccharide deacetylase, partial [Vallitaleaceae bacterium]|nr:polysaccharide deacetylase [Vallitaleaceae bacterium]
FRPPSGTFSERVLFDVRKSGYRTIFWSLGYGDWDAKNQPGKEFAYSHIMENFHPGGIFLLHGVSQSTTEALDDVIKALKAEGYRFGNLYEIE